MLDIYNSKRYIKKLKINAILKVIMVKASGGFLPLSRSRIYFLSVGAKMKLNNYPGQL